MSDDADRLKEIEAKLARLKTEILTVGLAVSEQRLDMRRIEEKLDRIMMKLFEPERLRLEIEEFCGLVEKTDAPTDLDDVLTRFRAAKLD